jgi:hypothetical protein
LKFSEYKSSRDCDRQIERCAELMERFGVDADAFIDEFVREQTLDEGLGKFWQGTKDFFKGAWNAAREKMMNTPDQSIWHAGMKNAISQSQQRSTGASSPAGGGDAYTNAKQSLQALRDFLTSNEKAKSVTSANRGNVSVADYIGQLLQSLERETGAALLAQGKDVAASAPGESQQQVGASGTAGAYQGQGAIDTKNLPPNMQPQAQQQAQQQAQPQAQPQAQQQAQPQTKPVASKKGNKNAPANQTPSLGTQQQVSSGGGWGGSWTT